MEYTQMNTFDRPANTPAQKSGLVYRSDDFDCCDRYRQCSDAGHCILADQERASHCYYRRNLEAGRIFYGKNANGFSRDRYAQLLRRVDTLSQDAHTALDNLLIEFLENHRGIRRCVVRNRCTEELAALELFSFQTLGPDFPPPSADLSKMYVLIREAGYGQVFKSAQEARTEERKQNKKKAGPTTWDFLREWLNGEGCELRDRLASPYCMASLPPEQILYAEELYLDTLKKSFFSRIYPPSPYAEDGILSAAKVQEEELRRIQFSHGYSQEEKDRLMASAMQKGGASS